jgi:AcrR family transcriptional regulator
MYEMPQRAESLTDLDDFWPPSATAPHRRRDAARPEQARRPSALSRSEIVRAAVSLADSEGAGAVNMRRIAKELGVSTMSLYWHVADKDQLLDLMLDAVEGENGARPVSGEWREDLAGIARQRRQTLRRHPWVVDFMSGRQPFGPNALLQIEQSLAVLDGVDIDIRMALRILMTVDTYVTGSVLNELREIRVEETRAKTGLDEERIVAAMRDWRDQLDRSGMFVRVLRVFDEGIDPDAAESRDERFEFGLRCVLDGASIQLTRTLTSG